MGCFFKRQKSVAIVKTFQKVLDDSTELHSKRKPNKIWVDKRSEFYIRSIKSWLQDNNIEMYLTHNEGKSVVDHVTISKYKNIFTIGCTPNLSEEVFVNSKIKNTVPWTYVINDSNGEKIIGTFMKKSCKKQIKNNLRYKK